MILALSGAGADKDRIGPFLVSGFAFRPGNLVSEAVAVSPSPTPTAKYCQHVVGATIKATILKLRPTAAGDERK